MNGDRLSPEEARTEIFMCAFDGYLLQTAHFQEKLSSLRISFGDATSVLMSETSRIYKPPEWDDAHHEWKYCLEGYEPDGKWLVIIFSFLSEGAAKLITVFSGKPRTKPRKGS
jgi:hypothetical protein